MANNKPLGSKSLGTKGRFVFAGNFALKMSKERRVAETQK
jgi:hypothetical protein